MKGLTGILFSIILLCGVTSIQAQTPEWEWATGAGGLGEECCLSITTDSLGNQYITGYFEETATFGTYTLTISGERDIFVAKIDTFGNWLWAVQAGGNYDEHVKGTGIAVDSYGNSYITGSFTGTATFGPYTLTSNGSLDIFVAKLNSAGNFLWAVSAGGTNADSAYGGITLDYEGYSYITGKYTYSAIFGSITLIGSGNYDIYVAKLDPEGNWLSVASAGSSYLIGFYSCDAIDLDDEGNAHLTGYFQGDATFGNNSITSGSIYDKSTFVAKLSSAGTWIWAVSSGGADDDSGRGISVDNVGNSYITGDFNGTVDFGPFTLTDNGWTNIFAAKLDSDGNFLWAINPVGPSSEVGEGVALDSSYNPYLSGYFRETVAFGPFNLTASGFEDIFAAKLDTDGNFLWAIRAGGTEWDRCLCIALDSTENIYISGVFQGNATFGDYTLTSSGEHDIFIAKLSSVTPVDEYISPDTAAFSRLYDAYPNPLRQGGTAMIKTNVGERETGILTVLNLRGQIVSRYTLDPGRHQISLASGKLPSGIYLYQLQTQTYSEMKKLVLLK